MSHKTPRPYSVRLSLPNDEHVRLALVATSRPVDSAAHSVARKLGIHYEPKFKPNIQPHSETPLPVKPYSPDGGYPDLTGVRFGRFVVFGVYDSPCPVRGCRWVVRCACGCYEIRKSRAIKKPKTDDDRCKKCCHLRYLTRRYEALGVRHNDADDLAPIVGEKHP